MPAFYEYIILAHTLEQGKCKTQGLVMLLVYVKPSYVTVRTFAALLKKYAQFFKHSHSAAAVVNGVLQKYLKRNVKLNIILIACVFTIICKVRIIQVFKQPYIRVPFSTIVSITVFLPVMLEVYRFKLTCSNIYVATPR